jgi:hypothetical protein
MAKYPDWFDRLDSILTTLGASPLDSLDRREIEALFACSERDSLRLLNRFGANKTGGTLQIERASLVRQLEALRTSGAYRSFLSKEDRVTGTMAVAKPASRARFRRIAGSAEFEPRRLGDLPDAITLAPGLLQVRFELEEDLWYLLDQLADIAAQDSDAFRRRVEPRSS